MKGPSGRGKFDMRRIWECPLCKKRRFTSGQVAHLGCNCTDKTVSMCLLHDPSTGIPAKNSNIGKAIEPGA